MIMKAKMPDLKKAIITNKKTGKKFKANDWNELGELALEINAGYRERKEIGGLVYCDLEAFAYGMDGKWYLLDECGNFETLQEEEYEVEFPDPPGQVSIPIDIKRGLKVRVVETITGLKEDIGKVGEFVRQNGDGTVEVFYEGMQHTVARVQPVV